MAGIFDDFVKQGQISMKGKKLGVWSRRWLVLRSYSSSGPSRLELYNEVQGFHRLNDPSITPLQVIPLVEVAGVRVGSGHSAESKRTRKVVVSFANCCRRKFKFRCESYDEAEQWRRAMEQVLSPVYDDIREWTEPTAVNSRVNEKESFRVFLMPSRRLAQFGECQMEVTSNEVTLREFSHFPCSSPFVTWEFSSIRRFGLDNGGLKIETGRSSSTGEHIFTLRSFEAKKIERHLNTVTSALSTALHLAETDIFRRPSISVRPQDSLFDYDFRSGPYQFSGSIEGPRDRDPSPYSPDVDRGGPCPVCSSHGSRRILAFDAGREIQAISPDPNRRPSAPNPVSENLVGSTTKRRLYSIPAEAPVYPGRPIPYRLDPRFDESRRPYFNRCLPSAPSPVPGSPNFGSTSGTRRTPVPLPSDRNYTDPSDSSYSIHSSSYQGPGSGSFFSSRRSPPPIPSDTAPEETRGSPCRSIPLPSFPPAPAPRNPHSSSSSSGSRHPNPVRPNLPSTSVHASESSSGRRPRVPSPTSALSSTRIRQLAKSERDLTHSMTISTITNDIPTLQNRRRKSPDCRPRHGRAGDSASVSRPCIPPFRPSPSPPPPPRPSSRSPPPPPVPERSFRRLDLNLDSAEQQPSRSGASAARYNRQHQRSREKPTPRTSRSFSADRRRDILPLSVLNVDSDSDTSEDS